MPSTLARRAVSVGALAAASAALAVASCDDADPGTGGASASSTATQGSSGATMVTAVTSTNAGSTSTGNGPGMCGTTTEITLTPITIGVGDTERGWYRATVVNGVGGPETDPFYLELYGPAFAEGLDGHVPGTYDLAAGIDTSYATCARCILVRGDELSAQVGKGYFQKSGTITVEASSDPLNGKLDATLTDLTLIEVFVDGLGNTTPVDDGDCLHIASLTIAAEPAAAPMGWSCDTSYYGDFGCDCGCAVLDVDCVDGTVDACEACDGMGSCSMAACPGDIAAMNNAICTP